MNSDSTSDTTNTATTTAGICMKNLPVCPGTMNSGKKATMLVSTAKQTGAETSLAPSMAARRKGTPRWRCSYTFSPTTTASSTTMPNVTMKANSEIMLMDAPVNGMNRKEPRMEMGMPSVTQKASFGSRNRPSSSRTSTSPRNAFFSSRLTRPR